MSGDHRHEKSQPKPERPNPEGSELDRKDQGDHWQWRAVRHEQFEEAETVAPEADDQNDRKAHDSEDPREAELAGRGEGMEPGDNSERQKPQEIRHKDECEQGEDIGDELLS